MSYVNKQNKGQAKVERLSLLSVITHGKIPVNVQNDVRFPGHTFEFLLQN